MLKIAFISTEKLPVPPVAGGAVQIYIQGILPYLGTKHDITVYTVKNSRLENEEIAGGVRFIRVDAEPKEVYISNVIDKLEDDFQLVHIFNRPKWVRLVSDRLPGTAISLSLHNEMFRPQKISEREAVECIQRVEFINTVSRFVADGVSRLYPEAKGKLHVVYSGADYEKYKARWSGEGMENRRHLLDKYGLAGFKVVLFVGRVNQKKGVDILLKAMKIVTARYPRTALMVIGSSWFGNDAETDYIRQLKALAGDIGGKIVFTGFLPPDEVCRHYNAGDIFVCPSQWNEPLARVHYEAMAAGLPIITTNRGGNAEVIRGYGNGLILNDFSNPRAMAQNIIYLLRNPKHAARIGWNGRRAVEQAFNFKQTAEHIASELQAVEKG